MLTRHRYWGLTVTRQHWRDTFEGIGFVALICSLIFVGLQMRQDHRLAQAQNAADFDDTMIEYARVINANREVWMKGLEGADLTPTDEIAFETVAFAVWQKFFGIYDRSGLLDGRPQNEIARQLASELYIFPGLRRYFVARCDHHESMDFSRPFCRDVREQLSMLDNGTLRPPEGKLYVL